MSQEVGISTMRDGPLAAAHDVLDSGQARALLVDDDDALQNILRTVLERAGHEASSVGYAPLVLEAVSTSGRTVCSWLSMRST
jgi:DNA-binding NtrC family response regulator